LHGVNYEIADKSKSEFPKTPDIQGLPGSALTRLNGFASQKQAIEHGTTREVFVIQFGNEMAVEQLGHLESNW
jgi:hypothetical protein